MISNYNKKKTLIITEQQYNDLIHKSFKTLLNEDQTSSSIRDARNLLMKTYGWDKEKSDKFIRIDLRNDLPSLRSKQGGKFILGVTRMFINNELNDASTINRLNATLKYVASDAHYNEYDRNLNGMSANDLIQRFATARTNDLESDKTNLSNRQYTQNTDYTIIPINSFEEAEKYGKYTSWCVTHYENMFDSYTSEGFNQFYFCLKNGFESLKPVQGEGCPLDEYGLSMIAVCVDEDGALATCTCRWNHDMDGNDNIMNTEQISDVIGQNFYEVFKPNNVWKEKIERALYLMKIGRPLKSIFDDVISIGLGSGRYIVSLGHRNNIITENGEFLLPVWYDFISMFTTEEPIYAIVEKNDMKNAIDLNGNLLLKEPVDSIYEFDEDGNNAVIEKYINGKRMSNLIDKKFNIMFDDWFNFMSYANERGYRIVTKGDLRNAITPEGNFVSNEWFDKVGFIGNDDRFVVGNKSKNSTFPDMNVLLPDGSLLFSETLKGINYLPAFGLYEVLAKIDNTVFENIADRDGNMMFDEWPTDVYTNIQIPYITANFNGEYIIYDINGKPIINNIFEKVGPVRQYFHTQSNKDDSFDYIWCVKLNGKYNFINEKGEYLTNKWFDETFDYSPSSKGANVVYKGKSYFLNNNFQLEEFYRNESGRLDYRPIEVN